MHKDELWQTFAINGEPIIDGGRPATSGNPSSSENVRCGVAATQLYRETEDGSYELLFQRRSLQVHNGGMWDVSACGHMNYGETIQDAAIREAREEIGATIDKKKLQFIGCIVFSNFFAHTFLYDYTGCDDNFSFSDAEVMDTQWVRLDQLDEFWHTKLKNNLAINEVYLTIIKQFFELKIKK